MKKLLLAIALMAFGFAEDVDLCERDIEKNRYEFLKMPDSAKEKFKKLTISTQKGIRVGLLLDYAMFLECRFNVCVYGDAGEECRKYFSEKDKGERVKHNPLLEIMD